MSLSVVNILDLVDRIGISHTEEILALFSTKKSPDAPPLNPDVERFLKENSLQFAREKKSVTYLICDLEDGEIYAYFTIAHKALEITPEGLSKTALKRIERYAQRHSVTGGYFVSAFLIAQFAKNYLVDTPKRVSGSELMSLVEEELYKLQHSVGGGVVYLDCEPNANLINFYQEQQHFTLFGERISENDGKRYLQYLKFF